MCSGIVCFPGCNLSFIDKSFSYMTKKLEQKFKYLKNAKSLLGEIRKHSSSLLKGFQLPEIVSGLRVRH